MSQLADLEEKYIGCDEARSLLGVSRQNFYAIRNRRDFPEPLKILGSEVYDRASFLEWRRHYKPRRKPHAPQD